MNKFSVFMFSFFIAGVSLLSASDEIAKVSPLNGISSFTVFELDVLENNGEIRKRIKTHLEKMGKVICFEEMKNADQLVSAIFASSALEIGLGENSKFMEGSIKVIDSAVVVRNQCLISASIWSEQKYLPLQGEEVEEAQLVKSSLECVDLLLAKFSKEYAKANAGKDLTPTFILFPGWE